MFACLQNMDFILLLHPFFPALIAEKLLRAHFLFLLTAFMQVCPVRKNVPLFSCRNRYFSPCFVLRSTDPIQNSGSVNITMEGFRGRPGVWDLFRGATEATFTPVQNSACTESPFSSQMARKAAF